MPLASLNGMYRIFQTRRDIRFLLIGCGNTLSGYIVSSVLYYVLHTRMPLLALITITTVINVTISFVTNKSVVFRTKGNLVSEYLRFYLVSLVPIILGFVLLPIFVDGMGMNPYLAIALVTGVGVIASYFGHSRISFRRTGDGLNREIIEKTQ